FAAALTRGAPAAVFNLVDIGLIGDYTALGAGAKTWRGQGVAGDGDLFAAVAGLAGVDGADGGRADVFGPESMIGQAPGANDVVRVHRYAGHGGKAGALAVFGIIVDDGFIAVVDGSHAA